MIFLTCNLYCGQKAIVRTEHEDTEWFPIGKGAKKGCILSLYLVSLCAECIIQKTRLDSKERGVKIGGRNINNLRYADDTNLQAENNNDLKLLLMK